MREKYLQECEIIFQNSEYTAEAHHIIANKKKRLSLWLQILPAIISASLGVFIGIGKLPDWTIWLSVISAVVVAVASVINPLKGYYDHLNSAKKFTTMKHEARALGVTFSSTMNDDDFLKAVKNLHKKYNNLVDLVPPTDEKSFEKARDNIQEQKKHEPDEFKFK